MSLTETLAFWRSDPYEDLAESMARIRGDADALAMLPYDDGTFFLKPANFDKELVGGQGGYETDDGDKIVLDGEGKPVREFMGINVISALDPTEHVGAVEHVKAHMAHKNDIGEWLKVDTRGNVIEAGQALSQHDQSAVEVGPEQSPIVSERAEQIVQEEQIITQDAAYGRAIAQLEQEGEVTKIMDIAPPAGLQVDEEGGLHLEQATHIAVDLSKASDLMPTTTSTTELNTALDKARMEEYDEGKLIKYMVYGVIMGFLTAILGGAIMVGINAFV